MTPSRIGIVELHFVQVNLQISYEKKVSNSETRQRYGMAISRLKNINKTCYLYSAVDNRVQ